ncbi:MAG: YlmC/YmxH family sporulation protein [Ruminococcus sp.]|nr:YlmC/YmxH family sporulation protein [Ruminococcus sp.]MBR1753172.1 YlmC/YmxH family sporulation protein [Ruminococcus sp.]
MVCSLSDLRTKEVVNASTGLKLGFVDDIEFDTVSGNIVSIIIYGRPRAFGIMGRDSDIIIKCEDIELIGEDTILVRFAGNAICTKSRSFTVENLSK